MLKLIFFCFFMMPLVLNYWILCNMLVMLTLMFIFIFHKHFL